MRHKVSRSFVDDPMQRRRRAGVQQHLAANWQDADACAQFCEQLARPGAGGHADCFGRERSAFGRHACHSIRRGFKAEHFDPFVQRHAAPTARGD